MLKSKSKKQILLLNLDSEVQNHFTDLLDSNEFNIKHLISDNFIDINSINNENTWDLMVINPLNLNYSQIDILFQFKAINSIVPIILIKNMTNTIPNYDKLRKIAFDLIDIPLSLHQVEISLREAFSYRELNLKILKIREEIKSLSPSEKTIIGRSPRFLYALDIAKKVASSNANIFITGESGTGKEVFAKFIHDESKHQKGPFVAINCSAIPENLLESELFGHTKGSFTGAQDKRIGMFEEAQDGTLFLDEIGDLGLPLQAKILRVLQERKIKRIGENQYRSINCRIISATNRDLPLEIQEHRFREDLFFRLDVIPITLPPLRERREDILRLSEVFLARYINENHLPNKTLTYEAIKFLYENDWRGNIRELENTIERALVLSQGSEITLENLMPLDAGITLKSQSQRISSEQGNFFVECHEQLPSLEQIIQKYIEFAVTKTGGARDKAAREIGIDRKTLYKRLKVSSMKSQNQFDNMAIN